MFVRMCIYIFVFCQDDTDFDDEFSDQEMQSPPQPPLRPRSALEARYLQSLQTTRSNSLVKVRKRGSRGRGRDRGADFNLQLCTLISMIRS